MKTSKLRPLSWLIHKFLVLKLIKKNFWRISAFTCLIFITSLSLDKHSHWTAISQSSCFSSGQNPSTTASDLDWFLPSTSASTTNQKKKSQCINMVFGTTTITDQLIQINIWNSLLFPTNSAWNWPSSGFVVPTSPSLHPVLSFSRCSSSPFSRIGVSSSHEHSTEDHFCDDKS